MKKSGLTLTGLLVAAMLAAAALTGGAPVTKPAMEMPRGAFVEKIDNWNKYYSGPVWEKVFKTLEALPADAPVGNTNIQGDDIILKISTYNTKPAAQAQIESHRDYIDIQFELQGGESYRWYPLQYLKIKKPYNPANDSFLYDINVPALAQFDAKPRYFAVFTPQDGHQPGIYPEGATAPTSGRKAVIKLRASLVMK